MVNTKASFENLNLLNGYQETGTVIYTGDGIAMITCLSKVQQSSNKNTRNCVKKFHTGRRYFSSSASTESIISKEPDDKEKLIPIILPQFDLTSIIYSFIVHSLLFTLLIREKFLIALGIILGSLCVSFVYYFFLKNNERVREFLMQMRCSIAIQPRTMAGIKNKIRLLFLTWWILVVHFFFYTIGGYIL